MNGFQEELDQRLARIRQAGLYRELRPVDSAQSTRIRVGNRELLNFSSNDYLGLANHEALREAAARVARLEGAGSGASRLISGSLRVHHALEEALAAWKGTQAALVFTTGYAAALGTLPALLDQSDVVVLDRLSHACLVDAARLSGAKLRVFAHNDLNDLERILHWAEARSAAPHRAAGRAPRVLVVTESVFSMDGDQAPLRELVELKDRFGAWLMVDEAHATGLFGARRRGLIEACGMEGRVEVQMGTLGKALGAAGGYVCGSRILIDYLVNRARSFIFSTAPVPASSGAALCAVDLVQSAAGAAACARLWENVSAMKRLMRNTTAPASSAILPLILGNESAAVEASAALRELGLFVPAVRFPAVARGSARLRLTLTATHSADELQQVASGLASIAPRLGSVAAAQP